jgi:hypothetical protein
MARLLVAPQHRLRLFSMSSSALPLIFQVGGEITKFFPSSAAPKVRNRFDIHLRANWQASPACCGHMAA